MRKAITPIIAILIMLLITVSISLTVYFWYENLRSSTGSGADIQAGTLLDQLSSDINIPLINKTAVFVQNTGKTELSGINFFIDDNPTPLVGPARISPGIMESYYFVELPSAEKHTIKVVSSQGVSDEYEVSIDKANEYWS